MTERRCNRTVTVNDCYDNKVPKHKPVPMEEARIWLGSRLKETQDGYRLDGVPVNLTAIMRATNYQRALAGYEQITPNEAWAIVPTPSKAQSGD